MQNIHNTLPLIGHGVGHQSDLDESSRLNSPTFLHEISFRAYLVLSTSKAHIDKLKKTDPCQKGMFVFKTKALATSLKRRWWGLGIHIHMKMIFI